MTTAIIIAGILRNTINASSSWLIPGDYHLITENRIYSPQSPELQPITAVEILNDIISRSSVNFSSVNMINNYDMMYSSDQLQHNPEFRHHPTINMALKWKWAYAVLSAVQDTRKYNKILLLRPDLYLDFVTPLFEFAECLPLPNHYHSCAEIDTTHPRVGDTCVMFNWEMFGVLSKFFDYYVMHYQDSLTYEFDIHSLLARYLIERNVAFSGSLSQYLTFAILRDNTTEMFKDGKLESKYSIHDLKTSQNQWWKDIYGENQHEK